MLNFLGFVRVNNFSLRRLKLGFTITDIARKRKNAQDERGYQNPF